jgi:isoprenylcysteine carboxyl methyltransferase (ICMT) family protein YpbQ
MRLWLAAPDWLFRVAGALFFFGFVWQRVQKYQAESWEPFVPWCLLPGGQRIDMPWVPILVDLTFVLIALSFCFRMPPRTRASNGWVVGYALLTGFAPLLLLWIAPLAGLFDPTWASAVNTFMWRQQFTWQLALAGGVLLTIGNTLDVWGYSVLWRSFSIVPEPRALKTTGPYRWVRHPVYLGQFLAQAAVLLIYFKTHLVWIGVYALFVAMQLYRSKLEDRVLEKAFGEPYRAWKAKTFWFV